MKEPRIEKMRIKLDIPLKVSEIAKHVSKKAPTLPDRTVSYITTSSKEVAVGDLFIALPGDNKSGEDYVYEAKKSGALCLGTKECDICATNSKDALLSLARYYKTRLKNLKYTVAITGSVGKTTTKEFLSVILSKKYCVHKNFENYNNEIGVPLTVLSASDKTEILICELGMNHSGEISNLGKHIKPDFSIITNIGTAHIGNLGSRENIAKAKLEIYEHSSKIAVPFGEPLLNISDAVTFSSRDKRANVFVSSREDNIDVYYDSEYILSAPFYPRAEHFISCLCAGLSVCKELGIEKEILITGISDIKESDTRTHIRKLYDFTILEDCYNASVESFLADFKLIKKMGFVRSSALIGTMLELGAHSENLHEAVGRFAAEQGIDSLYLLGDYSESVAKGALDYGFEKEKIHFAQTHADAAHLIQKHHTDGEIILFKGSRAMKLEKVINELEKM